MILSVMGFNEVCVCAVFTASGLKNKSPTLLLAHICKKHAEMT